MCCRHYSANRRRGDSELVTHVGGTKGPFALRVGNWKYISPGGGFDRAPQGGARKKAAAGPQLYDLGADLAEEQNLAASQPAKVGEMQALLEKIRENQGP